MYMIGVHKISTATKMELKGTLLVFGVGLLLIGIQDAEAAARCVSDYLRYQTCFQYRTSYCCPYKSYSTRHYGTTFSTCCNLAMKYTNNRYYCSNSLYARYYCRAGNSHCCPSILYTSRKWMTGCCSRKTTSRMSCLTYGSNGYTTCSGTSSYCCGYKSRRLYGYTTASCCDSSRYSSWPTLCSNVYETYWCRSPSESCCSSRTYVSGGYRNGCCPKNTRPPTNVGAIIGGIVGGIILIVIVSVTLGVVCQRKAPPTSGGNTGVVVQAGGYQQQPQMAGAYPPQTGPAGYPQQGGLYVVGAQPVGAQPPAMPNAPVGAQFGHANQPPSYDNIGFS